MVSINAALSVAPGALRPAKQGETSEELFPHAAVGRPGRKAARMRAAPLRRDRAPVKTGQRHEHRASHAGVNDPPASSRQQRLDHGTGSAGGNEHGARTWCARGRSEKTREERDAEPRGESVSLDD